MKSFDGRYLGGHPAHPGPIEKAHLTLSDDGIVLFVVVPPRAVFGTLVESEHRDVLVDVKWHEITAVAAEGPDAMRERFTATRIALLGPFALALPKKMKNECYLVVEGAFGEFFFAVKRGSVQELRAELAPLSVHMRHGASANKPSDGEAIRVPIVEALKELVQLRDHGELTQEEFLMAKADLFRGLET
jgi:hypothetical protein